VLFVWDSWLRFGVNVSMLQTSLQVKIYMQAFYKLSGVRISYFNICLKCIRTAKATYFRGTELRATRLNVESATTAQRLASRNAQEGYTTIVSQKCKTRP
jgi:hypothetical protein